MATNMKNTILESPVRKNNHSKGPQSAGVTLIEYGDYGSELCGQATAFVNKARLRFGDRMRFVFRHFVVSNDHSNARNAAEAAEAAGAQGKFWQMHDLLLTHQNALDTGYLVEYADLIRLDISRFLRDMAAHVYEPLVDEDFQSGKRFDVHETPTFFVNGIRCESGIGETALLAVIEAALAPPI